ncbi:unnamed protein product [Choristocarpus tenellus]
MARMKKWIPAFVCVLLRLSSSTGHRMLNSGPVSNVSPVSGSIQYKSRWENRRNGDGGRHMTKKELKNTPPSGFTGRTRLMARVLGDGVAAALASLFVSPFISVVDRAIITSASGGMSMSATVAQGLVCIYRQPKVFLTRPDFLCTFGLYAATYLAANVISTLACEANMPDLWPKFFGTTAVNMPGSIAKDQALTKMFGSLSGAGQVPCASFALFTARDMATMAAAFTLPTPMSDEMQKRFNVDAGFADGMSQMLSPGLIQVFSTPVHILGLDLYNHPSASPLSRLQVIKQAFAPAMVLRVSRIGAAFGIGGLSNTSIRKHLHGLVPPPTQAITA